MIFLQEIHREKTLRLILSIQFRSIKGLNNNRCPTQDSPSQWIQRKESQILNIIYWILKSVHLHCPVIDRHINRVRQVLNWQWDMTWYRFWRYVDCIYQIIQIARLKILWSVLNWMKKTFIYFVFKKVFPCDSYSQWHFEHGLFGLIGISNWCP